MARLFVVADTQEKRRKVLHLIRARTGVMHARLRGLRETTDRFAREFQGVLDRAALSSFRDCARRGINDFVTRSAIIRGANARFAAPRILGDWGHSLEGLRLSARTRASFIARTETARIHSEADLVTMERLGVEKVDVLYSAGAFPCEVCPSIAAGEPYPRDRVPEGGIPFHPNCRCSYAPTTHL